MAPGRCKFCGDAAPVGYDICRACISRGGLGWEHPSSVMAFVVSRLRAEASRPENIASMRILVKLADEFEALSGASLPASPERT